MPREPATRRGKTPAHTPKEITTDDTRYGTDRQPLLRARRGQAGPGRTRLRDSRYRLRTRDRNGGERQLDADRPTAARPGLHSHDEPESVRGGSPAARSQELGPRVEARAS